MLLCLLIYGNVLGMAGDWCFVHAVEELLFFTVFREGLYIGYLWVW
jgi:hypothetical protein